MNGKHLAPEPVERRISPLRKVAIVLAFCVLGAVSLVAGMSIVQHRSPWLIVLGAFTPSAQQVFQKDHILALVEGLDYDYTAKDEEYSTHARSDIIMAANLDFTNKRIFELSIPRDMEATMPSGREDKINQAQSDGGVTEAQQVIASFLGIPAFDRYVILRVNTTKDLINAIGGVDINVQNSNSLMRIGANGPLDYDDSWGHLRIHLKPGLQHLNGDQAVGYARFRHDWCSDPCRIKRQQQVMTAFVAKLRNDKFNTLFHLNDLVGVFERDVTTNLTHEEEVSLAMSFIDMPKDGLHTAQVPYIADRVLANGGSVIIADPQKKAQLVQKYLIAPPAPVLPSDARGVAAVTPSSVRVEVRNGSGISGVAKRVAAKLQAQGFLIAGVSNARSQNIATTELYEHTHIQYAGLRVRQALGAAASRVPVIADSSTASPGTGSDVTLIVGQDLAAALLAQAVTQQ